MMFFSTYVAQALRTESDYAEYDSRIQNSLVASNLLGLIRSLIYQGQTVNTWKRFLIYGAEPERGIRRLLLLENSAFPEQIQRLRDPIVRRVLHAVLGLTTEAAEMAETIRDVVTFGDQKPIDLVNLREEAGDAAWYTAIAADASGISGDDVLRKNIEKLMVRYPDKFDQVAAIVRDLQKEREALEG